MNLPGELAAAVRKQARDQCEYCQMHQSLQGATFHLEHVIPRVKGGSSNIANLALRAQAATCTRPIEPRQLTRRPVP